MSSTTDVRSFIARITTNNKLSQLRSQNDKVQGALLELARLLSDTPTLIPAGSLTSSPHPTSNASGTIPPLDSIRALETKCMLLDRLLIHHTVESKDDLINAQTFLRLARLDPEAHAHLLPTWHDTIDKQWTHAASQAQVAVVFSDVIQQWLDTDGLQASGDGLVSPSPTREDSSEWSEVLEVRPVNPAFTFDAFLKKHKVPAAIFHQLGRIRSDTERFGKQLLEHRVLVREVRTAMESVARDPKILSTSVRRQIVEEKSKTMVLQELPSVFDSALRNLSEWQWPPEGIKQILQSHINGKQRLLLELDIVTLIFVEMIGIRWAQHFHQKISDLRKSKQWPKPTIATSILDKYINEDDERTFCVASRLDSIRSKGLVNLLEAREIENFSPMFERPYSSSYDDSDEVPSTDDSGWGAATHSAKPARTYAKALQDIMTDMRFCQAVDPERDIALIHADLENFGASMHHSVCLDALRFFGMPQEWLEWVRTFLAPPLIGPDGVKIGKTDVGTPFGLMMSSVANELTLITLDAALAFDARMATLRNHDDFWLWSQDTDRMEQAWAIMVEFADQLGLKWNMTKTGSCIVSGDPNRKGDTITPAGLPSGAFRWGLLVLQSDGTWTTDQERLDSTLDDAQREIQSTRSFLGKVNVWNKYQAFIMRNTACSIKVLGKNHVRHIQAVLTQAERRVTGGSDILTYMRRELDRAFPQYQGVQIPDGVFLWPVDLGGFHLHSQVLTLLLQEEKMPEEFPFTKLEIDKYDEVNKFWSGEQGERYWAQVRASTSHNSNATWARRQPSRPAMIDREKFRRILAVSSEPYCTEYVNLALQVDASWLEYSEMAKAIFSGGVEAQLGRKDNIVPPQEVPQYALIDLKEVVKKRFS